MLKNTAGSRFHHYPELDGVRGIAIVIVVAFHYNLAPFLGGVGVRYVQQPCSNPDEYPETLRKASYKKYLYLQGFCEL